MKLKPLLLSILLLTGCPSNSGVRMVNPPTENEDSRQSGLTRRSDPPYCVICVDGNMFMDRHCDIERCSEHNGLDYCFDMRVEGSRRRNGSSFRCTVPEK